MDTQQATEAGEIPPSILAGNEILESLARIELVLSELARAQTIRDFYTIDEFARVVGRSEFTVREWCRLGRVKASKRGSGRGKYFAWVVSHDELRRYQQAGLLPQASVPHH